MKTLFNPSFVHNHYPEYIYNENFQISTAHGTSIHNEVATIPLPSTFNTEEFHKIYLFNFNDNYQGLIGMDLLKQLDAKIDFSNNQLITKNCILPLYVPIEELQQKSISKNQLNSYIIPPRTETTITLPTNSTLQEGLCEKRNFGPNLMLPDAYVKVKNNSFTTTILNTSDNEIKLTITKPIKLHEVPNNDIQINHCQTKETGKLLRKNLINLRTDHMNDEEKTLITNLCQDYKDIFYCEDIPLSFTNKIKHKIRTSDNEPIFTKNYRYPYIHKQEVETQIANMLEENIIKPSESPWNAPIWVVPKKMDASKQQKWRIVVDYRKLNEKTIEDKFPIPNITDILDKLGRSQYFTTLDLASGFHQVEIDSEDIEKTAFSTDEGHYEFLRMPFGLKNAPATFQRIMNNVLKGLTDKQCFVYLDDVIIFSTSLTEHIQRLRNVFDRLRESNLKIQLNKSEFLRKEVAYLGHLVTPCGVKPNPEKISAIQQYPIPKNQKEIKQFLGLLGYYRKFIKDFAKITKPLTSCLKKGRKVEHSSEFVKSFETAKEILSNDPILKYPDFEKPFILTTDASNVALGAILSQGTPGKDLPIAYASRTLNESEQRYSTIEKELLAIVWATKYFRPYLYGQKFTIVTDHRPLIWLNSLKEPNSKLTRWRLKLEEYNYNVIYKKGVKNSNADALSRIQINPTTTQDQDTSSIAVIEDDELDQLLDEIMEDEDNAFDPQVFEKMLSEDENLTQNNEIHDTTQDSNTQHTQLSSTPSIPICEDALETKENQIIFIYVLDEPDTPLTTIKEGHRILIVEVNKSNPLPTKKKAFITFCKPTISYHCYFPDDELYKSTCKLVIELFDTNKPKFFRCTNRVDHIINK